MIYQPLQYYGQIAQEKANIARNNIRAKKDKYYRCVLQASIVQTISHRALSI